MKSHSVNGDVSRLAFTFIGWFNPLCMPDFAVQSKEIGDDVIIDAKHFEKKNVGFLLNMNHGGP